MGGRKAEMERKTKETQIFVSCDLDGTGESDVSTGIGFFDHMLTAFAKHSFFDLVVRAKGDLETDPHHTVEDVGILLGRVIEKALGDKQGLARYGWAIVPMDEALILTAIDLSGRSLLRYDVTFLQEKIGTLDTVLISEFFESVARNTNMTLHICQLSGDDPHHTAEAVFKSFARALHAATRVTEQVKGVPSTKGVL